MEGRRGKAFSLEEKCMRLEEELHMSNQTILSLLEQGAEARELELAGGVNDLSKSGSWAISAQTPPPPASKQLPLQPNPLWEPQGPISHMLAAKPPARPATSQEQHNASVCSMPSGHTAEYTSDSIGARSAGYCDPYRSDREADLISLSPPRHTAASADGSATLGAAPRGAGLDHAGLPEQDGAVGAAAGQADRLREARRKAAAAQLAQTGQQPPVAARPAWNAGPAAQAPPRGRRPTLTLRQPTQSLLPASLHGRRQTAKSCSPTDMAQAEARQQNSLAVRSSLPGNPVARLAAQRADTRRAAAGAPSKSVQAAQVVDRLQQPGQQAQLMTQPAAEGRGGPAGDAGAHQREAQMQLRLKNKLINELRDHKRQLAEELEAAVAENLALREAAARGGRAKEQADALLEALKAEREHNTAATQQAAKAREEAARAQQRVKALMGRQVMDRESLRKLEARLAEKTRVLEQLYATTKELKQQYEASQQEAAQAAAQAAAAVQGSRTKVEQHAQALAAAHLSLSAAATTATRTEELVEELSCDLRTEQEARKAAEAALEALQAEDSPNQGSPPESATTSQAIQAAERAWHARRQSLDGDDGDSLQAELSAAHRRADELQLRLDDSVAEARRYRQRAKWLAAEVAAFRGRIAGHVDEEELEGAAAATPDVARSGCLGEARGRLLDAQEMLRRQLHAQEMKAAESRRAAALAVEVAELKQQVAILTADSSLCPSLSQDTPRSLSDAVTRQDASVMTVKEAFEAMSASGGWSVYTNKAARRISAGGSSASA